MRLMVKNKFISDSCILYYMIYKKCKHCGESSNMDLIDCEGTMMYKCNKCTELNDVI